MKSLALLVFLIALTLSTAAADEPTTYVHGRDVRWNAVCLRVPDRFQPIGSFDFTLAESTGSRTIFAERNAGAVGAMVVVQTEHMTSDKDAYVYSLRPGVELAGTSFKVSPFAASDTLSARRSPNAEAALTLQFLQKHALKAPDEWLTVRYATYDIAGKNEFLVFYREPLMSPDLDLAAVGPSDLHEFALAFDAVRGRAAAALPFGPCPKHE